MRSAERVLCSVGGAYSTVTVPKPPAPQRNAGLFGANDTFHYQPVNLASSTAIQNVLKAAGLPYVRTWLFNQDQYTVASPVSAWSNVAQADVNARLNAVAAVGATPWAELLPIYNYTRCNQLLGWAQANNAAIPWFEIGNEMNPQNGQPAYGFTGFPTASGYYYTHWTNVVPSGSIGNLKGLFPSTKVCGFAFAHPVGALSEDASYMNDVVAHGSVLPDAISFHYYWNPGSAANLTLANAKAYYNAAFQLSRSTIDAIPALAGLPLALTEWGFNADSAGMPTWAQTSTFRQSFMQIVGQVLHDAQAPYNLQFADYFDIANQNTPVWIDLCNTSGAATAWEQGLASAISQFIVA